MKRACNLALFSCGALCAMALSALGACVATDLPLGDQPNGLAGRGGGADSSSAGSGNATSPTGGASPAGGSQNTTGSAGSQSMSSGGNSTSLACQPLAPRVSAVTLAASEIVGAGRDADGTLYVLTGDAGEMRLFSGSTSNPTADVVLAEVFESGTGQGTSGSVEFWTFQYLDAGNMQVTVEVQKDAAGTRMGVVKGAISGKGFDVGSMGDVLVPISAEDAAAWPASTTQTFHVEYAGAAVDGTNAVVIAPDHARNYAGFRVFLGPIDALAEQALGAVTISRGLSIPAQTSIAFTLSDGSPNGAPASINYLSDSGAASLQVGMVVTSLAGPAEAAVPPGAQFLCAGT